VFCRVHRNISPVENVPVAIIAFGEGWHNYHHVFPWDYKTSELGEYKMNLTTGFIDFFAWLGWAYDLKTVPLELVKRRARRTGDGSHRKQPEKPHIPEEQLQEPEKQCEKSQTVTPKITQHNPHHFLEGETPIWGWGDKDMSMEDARTAIHDFRSR
jgi:stearoyl-CoA desaturase (delta-9 desaturase)